MYSLRAGSLVWVGYRGQRQQRQPRTGSPSKQVYPLADYLVYFHLSKPLFSGSLQFKVQKELKILRDWTPLKNQRISLCGVTWRIYFSFSLCHQGVVTSVRIIRSEMPQISCLRKLLMLNITTMRSHSWRISSLLCPVRSEQRWRTECYYEGLYNSEWPRMLTLVSMQRATEESPRLTRSLSLLLYRRQM